MKQVRIDRPVIDQFIIDRVARHSFHDVALRLLVSQRDGRHHVSAEVNTEDGDCAERQRNVGDDEQQEWRDFRNVARQRVSDGLLEVVEDQATFTTTAGNLLCVWQRMGADGLKIVSQSQKAGHRRWSNTSVKF